MSRRTGFWIFRPTCRTSPSWVGDFVTWYMRQASSILKLPNALASCTFLSILPRISATGYLCCEKPLKYGPTLSHSESQYKYDFRDFLTKELTICEQEAWKHLLLTLLPFADTSLANGALVPSLFIVLLLFQNLKLPQNIGYLEGQSAVETGIEVLLAVLGNIGNGLVVLESGKRLSENVWGHLYIYLIINHKHKHFIKIAGVCIQTYLFLGKWAG